MFRLTVKETAKILGKTPATIYTDLSAIRETTQKYERILIDEATIFELWSNETKRTSVENINYAGLLVPKYAELVKKYRLAALHELIDNELDLFILITLIKMEFPQKKIFNIIGYMKKFWKISVDGVRFKEFIHWQRLQLLSRNPTILTLPVADVPVSSEEIYACFKAGADRLLWKERGLVRFYKSALERSYSDGNESALPERGLCGRKAWEDAREKTLAEINQNTPKRTEKSTV